MEMPLHKIYFHGLCKVFVVRVLQWFGRSQTLKIMLRVNNGVTSAAVGKFIIAAKLNILT
jgi:hypothetical protein